MAVAAHSHEVFEPVETSEANAQEYQKGHGEEPAMPSGHCDGVVALPADPAPVGAVAQATSMATATLMADCCTDLASGDSEDLATRNAGTDLGFDPFVVVATSLPEALEEGRSGQSRVVPVPRPPLFRLHAALLL